MFPCVVSGFSLPSTQLWAALRFSKGRTVTVRLLALRSSEGKADTTCVYEMTSNVA
jgi:hypothetical protein